MILYKV